MKRPCRYCRKEFNLKYLRIHQKHCKKRRKPTTYEIQFDTDSARAEITDPKLKEALGTQLDEFEDTIARKMTEKIQEDPQSFIEELKRKSYLSENQS